MIGGNSLTFELVVYIKMCSTPFLRLFFLLIVQRMVMKTKSVEYMPFLLSLCSFLCGTSWFVYGLLGKDPFLAVSIVIHLCVSVLSFSRVWSNKFLWFRSQMVLDVDWAYFSWSCMHSTAETRAQTWKQLMDHLWNWGKPRAVLVPKSQTMIRGKWAIKKTPPRIRSAAWKFSYFSHCLKNIMICSSWALVVFHFLVN